MEQKMEQRFELFGKQVHFVQEGCALADRCRLCGRDFTPGERMVLCWCSRLPLRYWCRALPLQAIALCAACLFEEMGLSLGTSQGPPRKGPPT